MASDGESEYGYDLSLEDEELLASLVDAIHPVNDNGASATQVAGISKKPHLSGVATRSAHLHAPDLLRGSPRGKTSLVGIARTDSVDAFVQKTQPQSVTYPDRRCPRYKKTVVSVLVLTDI